MAIVEIDTRRLQVTGFLPICQNQIQGLFKDLQGPYEGYIRKSKLNQTGNFISIYKRHMHIRGQKEAIWNNFLNINWFGHDVLENQTPALSRTFRYRYRFKDFQRPCLFSRTFQALKIWKKKFKDLQGPARAVYIVIFARKLEKQDVHSPVLITFSNLTHFSTNFYGIH